MFFNQCREHHSIQTFDYPTTASENYLLLLCLSYLVRRGSNLQTTKTIYSLLIQMNDPCTDVPDSWDKGITNKVRI